VQLEVGHRNELQTGDHGVPTVVRKNRPAVTNPDKVFGVRQQAAALQIQRGNRGGSTPFETDQRRFFLRAYGTAAGINRALAVLKCVPLPIAHGISVLILRRIRWNLLQRCFFNIVRFSSSYYPQEPAIANHRRWSSANKNNAKSHQSVASKGHNWIYFPRRKPPMRIYSTLIQCFYKSKKLGLYRESGLFYGKPQFCGRIGLRRHWKYHRGVAMAAEREETPKGTTNIAAPCPSYTSAESTQLPINHEDVYRFLFETIPCAVGIADHDGTVLAANPSMEQITGYRLEELQMIGLEALYLEPLSRQELLSALSEFGSVRDWEVQLKHKNDSIYHAALNVIQIEMGGRKRLLTSIRDTTQCKQTEEKLRKSEEKYRMLVENSLQGLAIMQDWRCVYCNNAFARIAGYSIEELLSLSEDGIAALMHPDDRARFEKRYGDPTAPKAPEPHHYECRLIRKDGTERWIEVFSAPIEYNARPAMQVVQLDITERKQMEKTLRESEERFRLIAETIDEIFWISDLEHDAPVYLSPAHERIWGHPMDDFYDNRKSFFDPIHPDDRERVMTAISQMKTGQPLDFEHRIVRPDGSIRHIWNRGYPVPDETGRISRYVGVAQDVTSRRNAERDLKESRESLNQIINGIGDPVFVKDRKHRFVLVNDTLCSFADKRREQMLGRTGYEHIPQEQAIAFFEQEEEVFNTGRECLSEDTLTDGQGRTHTIMTRKALLKDQRGNKQIVGVMRDITDQKRLEEQFRQAQKMEAIGVLAGGVAHDFNNLLSVINGYAELLMDGLNPDDPKRLDLEQIHKAGQRAAALTSQLLSFSRKQMIQPEIMDLNGIVADMGAMLRRLIGENIKLNTIAESNLGLINADPGQVQQIIMNLAVNAKDAMPNEGRLTIETANADFDENYVREHPIVVPGSYVMLAISDNGMGMDAETKIRIFEPFFTTKGKGKGTGLGLSTVYGIVKQSNGFIWVYSEPGKGTAFKIYFPRIKGEISQPAGEINAALEFRGSETILIAEDEEAVRALASRMLRERGYSVLVASDGIEALRLAREFDGTIHIILTDVVMPGMSGRALVHQLEKSRPGIKSLYISGYTDNAIVHQGVLDPNVAFLQKPFSLEALIRKVRDVIDSTKM
jgi:two-component system, cell cycle sensor histidine kinase and response regulator CckA